MFRWNLGLTTKLAYALSTVLILFLSSAFISLAHATPAAVTLPSVPDVPGTMAGSEGEQNIDYSYARFQQRWAEMRKSQMNYAERWQWRKSEYRLYEDYAGWLRDHGYYDNNPAGEYGLSWFSPMPFASIDIPTFVDMLIDIF